VSSRQIHNRQLSDSNATEPAKKTASHAKSSVGASSGGSAQHMRRHTFLTIGAGRRSVGVGPVVPTSAEVSRNASVVLDPNTLVHQCSRSCPAAKAVCWSLKAALKHPMTAQRLCPQPLRRKLKQKNGVKQPGLTHNHLALLEDDVSRASDEEVSSGDEEDFTSTDKDECTGKLAFGRRKIKFFDQITAPESDRARAIMKKYWREVYKRRFKAKLKHLQDARPPSGEAGLNNECDAAYFALEREFGVGDVELVDISKISDASATRAALIIESLSMNCFESIEGMAECYDGLVAAGAALIEHEEQKNRSNPANDVRSESKSVDTSDSDRLSVLATLTPLLITTLEPLPGEAIVQLSKLYNICATARYKRRLVHRIAPHLIRPPNGAMWCVKHQNDMAAITTVTEFLLEHAKDIFSPQWVERGRFLKADGLRAENLRLAALQLKSLNKKETSLQVLSTKSGAIVSVPSQDGDSGLAEWEILAVDRYIRTSIRFVFDRLWTSPKMTKHHAPSGRVGHHSATMSVSGTSGVPSVGGGGCPMSPRKIPLSPSTFVNSNSSAPSGGMQYVMEIQASSPLTTNIPGLPPFSSSSASLGNNESSSTPLTPKPGNPLAITVNGNNSSVGTPPRSPSSPPKPARTFGTDPGTLSLNPPNLSNSVSSSSANAPSLQSSVRRVVTPVLHHTLTKSAEERKRTVAACRALRAQINRFEEAFYQIHNRHPKGAAERAPLATTYAQYREWKRAIRADAATRIQALFRGALCRWSCLRSNSPRITQIVRRGSRRILPGNSKQLSIPMDMGDLGRGTINGPLNPSSGTIDGDTKSVASANTYGMDVEERTCVSTEGVELVINTAGRRNRSATRGKSVSQSLAASAGSGGGGWHLGRGLRSNKTKDPDQGPRVHLLSPKAQENFTTAPLTTGESRDTFGGIRGGHVGISLMNPKKTNNKYARMPSSNNSVDSGSDSEASQSSRGSRGSYSANSQTLSLTDVSLADLMVQKRELKAQLKSYDLNFAKRHGRMPVKAEKEPIRRLYEQYNALKAHISMIESGSGISQSGSTGNSVGVSTVSQPQPRHVNTMSQQQPRRAQSTFSSSDRSVDSAGSEDSFGRPINRNRTGSTSGGGINLDFATGIDSHTGNSSANAPLPTDLRALKEEKGALHQMLRSYEKDFFKEHNRQVSSFADIKPVASQYRRYKEIKKAIAAQQAAER